MTSKAKIEMPEMVFTGQEEPVEDELMKFETVKQGGKEIEFDKVKASDLGVKSEYRRIPVPQHRYTPLRQNWDSILKTLVEHMKLQVRMNTKRRAVNSKHLKLLLTSERFRKE